MIKQKEEEQKQKWERVTDLSRYYPEYLKDITELQQISSTENAEIGRLYQKSDRLWADGFIQTASIQGIRRWETLLGVRAYPGDSVEERRSAVLSRWNQQLPYTRTKLQERLGTILGHSGYKLSERYGAYELELIVFDQTYRVLYDVRDMTKNMIPANLQFIFVGSYPSKVIADIVSECRLQMASAYYARYNRKFLLLDGSWLLDGTYRLNGYEETHNLDLYPVRLELKASSTVTMAAESGCEITSTFAMLAKENERLQISCEIGAQSTALNCARSRMWVEAAPDSNCLLTVEKDLWYLDGTYLLDGEKLLDAGIFKYDL